MMKLVLAGLLAGVALAPVAAMAQEQSVRDVMRARIQARVAAQGGQRDDGRPPREERQRPEGERPQRAAAVQGQTQPGDWRRERGDHPDRSQARPRSVQPGGWQNAREERGDRDPQAQRPDPAVQAQAQARARGDWQRDRDGRDRDGRDREGRDWRSERRDGDRVDRDRGRGQQDARRGWNGNGGGWNGDGRGGWNDRGDDRRDWNRDWRREGRYDWNRYRTANRSAYRLPRYYAPYGWTSGYRRFSIGVRLAPSLFAQDYWIDDPYAYRLPDAYGPYRWVRYYDDALLVDVYSGQVVDVIHDIFW